MTAIYRIIRGKAEPSPCQRRCSHRERRMLASCRYGRWIALDLVHAAVCSIAMLAKSAAA